MTDEEKEQEKDGLALEATVPGAEATGCCRVNLLTSLACIQSATLLLLNR